MSRSDEKTKGSKGSLEQSEILTIVGKRIPKTKINISIQKNAPVEDTPGNVIHSDAFARNRGHAGASHASNPHAGISVLLVKYIAALIVLVVVGYFAMDAYFGSFASDNLKSVVKEMKKSDVADKFKQSVIATKTLPSQKNYFVWDPSKYTAHGTLELKSVPEATAIFIDNRQLVNSKLEIIRTPLKTFMLPPGTYVITLKNSALGVYKTETIEVRLNDTTFVSSIIDQHSNDN